MDFNGKADPFVTVYTTADHREESRVVHKTLAPSWNDTCWLFVQEPSTQQLRLEVRDIDFFNFKVRFLPSSLFSGFICKERQAKEKKIQK